MQDYLNHDLFVQKKRNSCVMFKLQHFIFCYTIVHFIQREHQLKNLESIHVKN